MNSGFGRSRLRSRNVGKIGRMFDNVNKGGNHMAGADCDANRERAETIAIERGEGVSEKDFFATVSTENLQGRADELQVGFIKDAEEETVQNLFALWAIFF